MTTFTSTASTAARLCFAAGAAATTLVLFSAVTSLSEPQRSVLIAKTHRIEHAQPAEAGVTVAMAAPAAKSGQR